MTAQEQLSATTAQMVEIKAALAVRENETAQARTKRLLNCLRESQEEQWMPVAAALDTALAALHASLDKTLAALWTAAKAEAALG